jgi:hypothetical protein
VKKNKPRQEALTKAVAMDTPERFKLAETGFLGLRLFNGITQDELQRELAFPYNLKTYKEMLQHSTINSSQQLFVTILSKADWIFQPPENATAEELRQVEIVNQMMQDMEHSWTEFLQDILSMNWAGFSVCEKVYRRRYQTNGSKHNDGLIGWKKLPIRSQESIEKFIFSDDGNEVVGVKQNLTRVADTYNRFSKRLENEVVLPKSKILHFRAGLHRGDPYGKSPLRDAYLAWKYLILLEELETTGVSKDLVGLPVLYIPPAYLAADADAETLKIRAYYENAMRNLQMNEQSAMVLPNMYDPDTKQPLFKLDLLSVDGKKAYDIGKIKEWYKNMIMISMSTDILTMGQTQVGSFALGSIKNSLAGSVALAMARNIADVLNRDLIRQTYELNGWNVERMGKIDFDNLIEADIEGLSKFWQRVTSVGLVEKDREVLNAVRKAGGVDALSSDLPPQKDLMEPVGGSKAGEGFKTAGEGTANSVSGSDTSGNNLDNAA